MHIHKQLKTLYLLLLATYPSSSYCMDLALERKHSIFTIQTYPSDLQCMVFESMLSHLNSYQTNFFEDNQKEDKKQVKEIGVLRYQIACFVIEHLLKNSIKPKKIPNSMAAIQDILYRGILFTPYAKMIKMNSSQLLKTGIKYKQISNNINKKTHIPTIITDILLNKLQTLFTKNKFNENFYYPGRPNLLTILKKEWAEQQPQENTPLLSDPIRSASNQIKIEPTCSDYIFGVFIITTILSGSVLGLGFLVQDLI